jgi:hypothetical protein
MNIVTVNGARLLVIELTALALAMAADRGAGMEPGWSPGAVSIRASS